jgi:hypothetical protein
VAPPACTGVPAKSTESSVGAVIPTAVSRVVESKRGRLAPSTVSWGAVWNLAGVACLPVASSFPPPPAATTTTAITATSAMTPSTPQTIQRFVAAERPAGGRRLRFGVLLIPLHSWPCGPGFGSRS